MNKNVQLSSKRYSWFWIALDNINMGLSIYEFDSTFDNLRDEIVVLELKLSSYSPGIFNTNIRLF